MAEELEALGFRSRLHDVQELLMQYLTIAWAPFLRNYNLDPSHSAGNSPSRDPEPQSLGGLSLAAWIATSA